MNVLDLFCGAGGFSEGFAQAGHTIVVAIDNDEYALTSHELNHPNTEHILLELGGFREDDNGKRYWDEKLAKSNRLKLYKQLKNYKFDVVIGSPPCTDFSNANSNQDFDLGLKLVDEYFAVVKHLKPKYYVGENVIPAIKPIKSKYHVSGMKINSADFGVPQKRERYFFGKFIHPDPTHAKNPVVNLWGDQLQRWVAVETILNKSNKNWHSFEELPENARKRIVDKQYQLEKGFRHSKLVNRNSVSFTLTAHHDQLNMYIVDAANTNANGKDRTKHIKLPMYTIVGRQNWFLCDLDTTLFRKLTLEELAAIMGFPKGYKFYGQRNIQMKQIGNAVCPPVARAIGERLK